MIKIPPCDLPMVPLVPMVPLAAKNIQGFLVTIGKNGTNSTIGRFTDFTIGRTPNVAYISYHVLWHIPCAYDLTLNSNKNFNSCSSSWYDMTILIITLSFIYLLHIFPLNQRSKIDKICKHKVKNS